MTNTRFTIGGALAHLREVHQPDQKMLTQALQMSNTTYLKVERDQREMSFLMALRVCQFYKIDLHEFIAMIRDEELDRTEISINKALGKIERKKAEQLKSKVIDLNRN